MRRRGGRGRNSRTNGGRLLDRLSEVRGLGLGSVRALTRPDGAPDDVELGTALADGERPAALAVSLRGGAELVGWARVAGALAEPPLVELIAAAPAPTAAARHAAETFPSPLPIRIVAAPLLAEGSPELFAEDLPGTMASPRGWAPPRSVVDRVVRVVEGAAVVTGAGGVRRVERGFVLYLRGTRVLEIGREGDAASVRFLEPERRQMEITEASFPRWGLELHETIVRLAQDPRLLDDGRKEVEIEEAFGAAAGLQLTARWLPWNAEGRAPIDCVGIDSAGRPVLGWARSVFGLAEVPAVLAAAHAVESDRAAWAPGSIGRARLALLGTEPDDAAADLLAVLGVEIEGVEPVGRSDSPVAVERDRDRDRERPRRRSRRRRRGRDDGEIDRDAEAADAEAVDTERVDAERGQGEARFARDEDFESDRRSEREDDATPEPGVALLGVEADDQPASDEAEARHSRARDEADSEDEASGGDGRRRGRRGRRGGRGRRERGRSDEASAAETPGDAEDVSARAAETPDDAEDVSARATDPTDDAETVRSDGPADEGDVADLEIEPEVEPVPAPPEPVEPVRRRRARAAICVRNDPDSILAALVLARDRRHVPFFYVCSQDELMDFFRGKATDVDESSDLLLVGFTAQPVPKEVIAAAELYRGRLQWLDHHEWPIEDVEMLREAIGRDSIMLAEGAASALAAVVEVSERRSRFTDKLLDLSGRRLSENDMEKWGYRLVGLIQRMASATGDHRPEISPVLSGKPTDLPQATEVYDAERRWIDDHDPRIVHFGEYQMAVLQVPPGLDAGEIGRRVRLKTGARLSLATREGDEIVLVGCNEEKRHVNVLALVDQVAGRVPWAHSRTGGDRIGRVQIDALALHPDRLERMIGEIVRHRSILYG